MTVGTTSFAETCWRRVLLLVLLPAWVALRTLRLPCDLGLPIGTSGFRVLQDYYVCHLADHASFECSFEVSRWHPPGPPSNNQKKRRKRRRRMRNQCLVTACKALYLQASTQSSIMHWDPFLRTSHSQSSMSCGEQSFLKLQNTTFERDELSIKTNPGIRIEVGEYCGGCSSQTSIGLEVKVPRYNAPIPSLTKCSISYAASVLEVSMECFFRLITL
ncbi:hypothetical protein V8B97DRAFT_1558476 [Scleroderma yunnanense]